MPIYEYECTRCGRVEEVMQQFSDKPLKACPECSGKLQKLISRSSFHLKGTGWYVTDYAGKSKAGESKPGESRLKNKPDTSKKSAAGKSSDPSPPKNSAKSDT